MKTYPAINEFPAPKRGCALSIGNFDGVHLGHQALLFTLRRLADEFAVPAVALTFEPHPLAILAPHRAPPRLTSAEERLELLRRALLDATVIVRSEPEFFSWSPDEFLSRIVERFRPVVIVEGRRFNFGRNRAGTIDTLRSAGERLGFAVRALETVRCKESPDTPEVSSSAIRSALRSGNVALAAAMLGRPHRIVGRVVAGDARGRRIGFPTANLAEIEQMTPEPGVYAAIAQTESNEFHRAAVNIGPQPTFGQPIPRVEAHLLEFQEELSGQLLGLHFVERLRETVRFDSVEMLTAQLQQDVDRCRLLLPEPPASHIPGPLPLFGRARGDVPQQP